MATSYETDVIAWANEQAAFIRMGKFDQLDLEHIADEIEDVGKSEQREFASRMAVLLAHLLKWQYQPERRGASWEITITSQRTDIQYVFEESPSLRNKLTEEKWLVMVWRRALSIASAETNLAKLPDSCPWIMNDVLKEDWLPT
jgi:hypothetical protein